MSDGAFCHYCQKSTCICTWKREKLPNHPPEEAMTDKPLIDAELAAMVGRADEARDAVRECDLANFADYLAGSVKILVAEVRRLRALLNEWCDREVSKGERVGE